MIPRQRSHIVGRSRLHRALDVAPPVTVIQAPVGFGKTTLVAQWLDPVAHPGMVVWVDAPHDGADLWPEIIGMMRIAGLVDSAQSPGPAALAHLLPSTPITLVVDAFDRVQDKHAHRALLDLVRRSSALRLIVCTRRPARLLLRSRSELDQILLTGRDLAFTAEEARQLLYSAGPSAYRLADAVHELTGGWPLLTRMVADALVESPGRDVRDVATAVSIEFLRAAVLPALQHEPLIQFILGTAILDEITPETAGLIADRGDAESWLAQLESAGVLDADPTEPAAGGTLYRWPPAARAALHRELIRRAPERAPELHGRLAVWHERAQRPDRALRHATAARDWPLVVRIIESAWGPLFVGHRPVLDAAITRLPRDYVTASPKVIAVRDMRLRIRNEPGDDLLLELPSPLPSGPAQLDAVATSPAAHAVLDTSFALMTAFRVRGMHPVAARYADACDRMLQVAMVSQPGQVAHRQAPMLIGIAITRMLGDDHQGAMIGLRTAYECAAGEAYRYVAPDAAGKLALMHALDGDVVRARRWLRRHGPVDGAVPGWLAQRVDETAVAASILVATDRLDRRDAAVLAAGLEQRSEIEQSWNVLFGYVQARLALLWGDRHGARAALRADRDRLSPWVGEGSTMRPLLDALEADLLIALGLGHQAGHLLATAPQHPILEVPRVRLALLSGDVDAAARVAAIALSEPTITRRARAALLMTRAAAQLRSGQQGAAVGTLRDALASIRAGGSLSALTAIPRPDLLALFERLPSPPDWVDLSAVPDVFPTRVEMLALTERERLVLAHIAQGLTTRQTADALFVSYNTVKSQLRSLYGKLGASSREEVIGIGRRRGLIADGDGAEPAPAGQPRLVGTARGIDRIAVDGS